METLEKLEMDMQAQAKDAAPVQSVGTRSIRLDLAEQFQGRPKGNELV